MPMSSELSSAVPDGATPSGHAHKPSLQAQYDQLRAELERLMREPVKDYLRLDQLVDQLELLQLAIKGEHGIQGNNPNE
jgi:hypothetical protein